MTDVEMRPQTRRWLEQSGMRQRVGVRLEPQLRRNPPNIVDPSEMERVDVNADK